jgi:hypothetical protein
MNEKNIRVFCRFRPLNTSELANGSQRMARIDKSTTVYIRTEKTETRGETKETRGETRGENKFDFDYIFPDTSQQEEVYNVVGKPLVEEVLKGYNATVFAYGQSGCLDPETEVLMYYGSLKKAKDVVLGDLLMGDDSTPRKVLRLYEGEDEMFLVKPVKGKAYTVNSSHVLTLWYDNALVDVPILSYLSKTDKDLYKGVKRLSGEYITFPIEVSSVGKGKYNGWTLDGNGRFLLSDFTVTHNSGKTTTMTGYSHLVDSPELLARDDVVMWTNPRDMGIVPRLIRDLFNVIKTKKDHEFSIQVSYVEIYLEKIRDLLNPLKDNLELRESRYKGLWIEDVNEVYVSSFEDALKVMRKGELNRTVAATAMNAHSSRSHSVLVVTLNQTNSKTQAKTTSRMVFVDLAGSEKVEKTKAEGILMKQAQATNKSLLNLGLVIRAIVEKKPHVPYRDSKLTRLLTDSLGGNSKTHLIVTCSSAIYNIEETVSTLRFGSIAQQIKNKPRVNLEMNVEEYKRQILQANEKIATQQGIIEALQKDINRLIALCEKNKIDVKAFKKEYSLSVSKQTSDETYEESFERFSQLTSEIEAKSGLIVELQKTVAMVRDEMEKTKDVTEVLMDDLDHYKQDLDNKTVEAENLTSRNTDLTRMYETLQTQLTEQIEKVSEVLLDQSDTASENSVLKARVSQLVEENQTLRENSLRTWKDSPGNSVVDENTLDKYNKLVQSAEDLKQLLEAKTRHIKVLEESLRANSTKIQELASEQKKKCVEYEKKIKDLESQMRILRNSTPPTNIFTPLKY